MQWHHGDITALPKCKFPNHFSHSRLLPQIAQPYIHCHCSCCEKAYLLVGKNRSLNFYFRLHRSINSQETSRTISKGYCSHLRVFIDILTSIKSCFDSVAASINVCFALQFPVNLAIVVAAASNSVVSSQFPTLIAAISHDLGKVLAFLKELQAYSNFVMSNRTCKYF